MSNTNNKARTQIVLNAVDKITNGYGAYCHEERGEAAGTTKVTPVDLELVKALKSKGLSMVQMVVFYDAKQGRHGLDDMSFIESTIDHFLGEYEGWDQDHIEAAIYHLHAAIYALD